MQLHKKLPFEEHLTKAESKINKTVTIILKPRNVLSRSLLFIVYKSFIRVHLKFDKAFN